ncbi:GspE/PulE family protein [Pseudomonas sp. zfem003]|uniref:GspE/PulE family protein n=1 Tax=Pseudomonas sp. zfem003 TaxID=3078198 RepID=UPI00292829E0|nr:GspE/PulE family protein [Pseudomonas sp. zfem003]MDU9398715.1 GspE/PulE family protein [Pseudomonas sp. zfem003]
MNEIEALVEQALADHQVAPGGSPVAALMAVTSVPEELLLEAVAQRAAYRFFYKSHLDEVEPAFDVISLQECLAKELLPVREPDGRLLVVLSDPYRPLLSVWLERALGGGEHEVVLACSRTIHDFMSSWGEKNRITQDMGDESVEGGRMPAVTVTVASLKEEHPSVRGLSAILLDAMNSQASDVHLENTASGLIVRLRLDGVLVVVNNFSGRELAEQIVSRVKVLSELDISERRIPQDGRFRAIISQRDVDIRVSIMPGLFGEDAVLRVLDRKHLTGEEARLSLERLGFDADSRNTLRRLARQPYGMLLITGPTGSGKTTTLYSLISEVRTGEEKIVTVEDPVEYQLEGVLQIPVNEAKGLTFARGLRSILRHDPDTIMVGEIRDGETAAISIQAALTGHTVFTSVHANNILDVIQRFRHMGVDAYAMTSAINGVVAQRLLRRICEHCSVPWTPDAHFLEQSGLARELIEGHVYRIGKGCSQCRGTGYRGRMAIAEFMVMDDAIRELIVSQAPISHLKAAVRDRGTRFLRATALESAAHGATSLQEVARVTFAE